jgi:hypothetical protein
MIVLQIEHPVRDFDAWKQVFDGDPLGREQAGVLRYQILRPLHDPTCAIVELAFATAPEAEAFLERLRPRWRQLEGTLIEQTRARLLEEVQSASYQADRSPEAGGDRGGQARRARFADPE